MVPGKRLQDELRLGLTLAEAAWACREAASQTGFAIMEADERRIVMKLGRSITQSPETIEVLLIGFPPFFSDVFMRVSAAFGQQNRASAHQSISQRRRVSAKPR
jgi:hypothetical protein